MRQTSNKTLIVLSVFCILVLLSFNSPSFQLHFTTPSNASVGLSYSYADVASCCSYSGYPTHWYAGGQFVGVPMNAYSVVSTLTVPSTLPRPDEFYYIMLSVFDNAGSYDQLGFAAYGGHWVLSFSYTGINGSATGYISCKAIEYHYPFPMILTPGMTYSFAIALGGQLIPGHTGIDFALYLGPALDLSALGQNPIWSINVPNGANSLLVGTNYCGSQGYTVYEEVWETHSLNGYPNVDLASPLNLYAGPIDHRCIPDIGVPGIPCLNYASWAPWFAGKPPKGVSVITSGELVDIFNPA